MPVGIDVDEVARTERPKGEWVAAKKSQRPVGVWVARHKSDPQGPALEPIVLAQVNRPKN